MVAVLVRLAAATLIASTSTAPARPPNPTGPLVFTSERSGTWQLWTVMPDGRRTRRLTRTGAADSEPAWSPDGTRVAFVRDLGDWRRPIVVRDVTSDTERTVAWPRYASAPAWSPDGRRIAFQIARSFGAGGAPDGRRVELWVVPAAGGRSRRLANASGYQEWQWAPDSRRLAFVAAGELVASVPAAGGRAKLLAEGRQPRWSPDGRRVAFVRDGDVFTVAADGTRERRLTHTRRAEAFPSWSPDGRRLAFARASSRGRTAVVVTAATGGGERTVALVAAHPSRPVWSPRGDAVAFGTDSGEVYTAGTRRVSHAHLVARGLEPDWR
jgi:TolB protein